MCIQCNDLHALRQRWKDLHTHRCRCLTYCHKNVPFAGDKSILQGGVISFQAALTASLYPNILDYTECLFVCICFFVLCIVPHQHKPAVNNHHTAVKIHSAFRTLNVPQNAILVSNHFAPVMKAAGRFDKHHAWIMGQEWGSEPESVLHGKTYLIFSLTVFPGTALPFPSTPPRASQPLAQNQNQLSSLSCCLLSSPVVWQTTKASK